MIHTPQKKTGTYTFLCSGAGHIGVLMTKRGRFVKRIRQSEALIAANAGAI
jgi:hypothetical protein